ncbi:unnamed protein product [Schistosoma margrebowiei]|uniref:Uncharacterized protein n=1 Tax=Schistosoma margrebowiei TaxID=48269 RepID=A0A183N2H3_9TREM|nr:unnamed protein product [Schistosoma margrebowiei]
MKFHITNLESLIQIYYVCVLQERDPFPIVYKQHLLLSLSSDHHILYPNHMFYKLVQYQFVHLDHRPI